MRRLDIKKIISLLLIVGVFIAYSSIISNEGVFMTWWGDFAIKVFQITNGAVRLI